MTTSPEAFLAREAEMCYAVMAHVTDYDVWHESEETVTVEMIVRTLQQNASLAQQAIRQVASWVTAADRSCECEDTLASALFTEKDLVPDEVRRDLALIIAKYYD